MGCVGGRDEAFVTGVIKKFRVCGASRLVVRMNTLGACNAVGSLAAVTQVPEGGDRHQPPGTINWQLTNLLASIVMPSSSAGAQHRGTLVWIFTITFGS